MAANRPQIGDPTAGAHHQARLDVARMLKRKSPSQEIAMTHCSFVLAAEGLTPDEVSEKLRMPRDGGQVLAPEIADISFGGLP